MLPAVATCLAGFDEILTLQWGASRTRRPFHLETDSKDVEKNNSSGRECMGRSETDKCPSRLAPPDATGATLHGLEPTMTNELTRRQLLSVGAAASVAALPNPVLLARAAAPAEMTGRKFYSILSLGRLGFQGSFSESLELAVKARFRRPGSGSELLRIGGR